VPFDTHTGTTSLWAEVPDVFSRATPVELTLFACNAKGDPGRPGSRRLGFRVE